MNLETALVELEAAKAARIEPAAALAELEEQYAELGRQAVAATTPPAVRAIEQQMKKIAAAQDAPKAALAKVDARIAAARQVVAKSA